MNYVYKIQNEVANMRILNKSIIHFNKFIKSIFIAESGNPVNISSLNSLDHGRLEEKGTIMLGSFSIEIPDLHQST